MRKLKLFMAACALTLGAGQTWAQTDVTSSYITNPGFEGESTIQTTYSAGTDNERYIIKPDGWTVVHTNPNTSDLTCLTSSDKQSNSFNGWTMAHSGSKTYWVRLRWGGQVWRSQADGGPTGNPTSIELQQQMTLPNGVYRLKADMLMYASGTEANNHAYLKASSSNNSWSVEPTINHSKSDNSWATKELMITSSGNTTYTVGLQLLQNWQVETIGAFDDVKLEKYTVDADHTLDITSIVPKGTNNWTNNGANNAGTYTNGGVDMVERYYAQHYTGTVSELVVKDLAQGVYDAEVYCQAHCADWNCSPIAEAAGQTDRTILSGNKVEVGIPIVNDKNLTEGPQVRTLTGIKVTDGTLTFKVRNDQEGANWLTFEIKSLTYKGVDLTEIKASYTTAKNAAIAARDNEAYSSITGAEREALVQAINANVEEDADAYIAATNTLISVTETFTDASTLANYALLATEKTKAAALGMSNEAIASATPNTKTGIEATQSLKVAEYNYVTTTYQYSVALSDDAWVCEATGTSAATFSNEHWSGTTHNYKNQNDNNGQGYNNANGWSINFSQDVTLPAGNYVFKVAGRQASGDKISTSLVVKNGNTELGTVSDFPRSNKTRGINKSGETAFDGDDADFANGGKGYGWEWRYVKFTLASEATVNIAINSVATAGSQWVSFGDYTLQTDDDANISLIAYNVAYVNATTARDNTDYAIVGGKEKADLLAAIAADKGSTAASIDAAKDALVAATTAFTAAATVTAYTRLAAAIAEAEMKSVAHTDATDAQTSDTSDAANATTQANALYVTMLTGILPNSYTLGFEDGEYAPYNIAAAKSFYDGANVDEDAVAAATTATLDAAINNCVANVGEVNAVNTALFTTGDVTGTGWTQTQTWGQVKEGVYSTSSGTFTYGEVTGFEMPLKANTAYKLTFNHRAWDGSNSENGGTVSVLCGEDGLAATSFTGQGTNTTPKTETFYFKTGAAGNYVFTLKATSGRPTFGGVTIVKAVAADVTISEDDNTVPEYNYANVTLNRTLSASYWNTFSVPFDAPIPDGWTVKEFDNATDINFKNKTGNFEAGVPYLVKPAAEAVNPTFDGVIVKATEGEIKGAGDYQFAAQIYNKSLATDGTIAYLATDGSIKKLNTANGLKGLRAYFIVPAGSNARIAFIDDADTGIDSMESVAQKVENGVYDLQGRRVEATKKGLYIINGKKVVK